MKLGAVHTSLGIYFMAEETSAKNLSDEGFATSHCFKWGPLAPNDVGMITGQVKEGRK